jgi:hypothetical protein
VTEAKRRREADGRSSRVPIPVGGTIVAAARAAIRDPWRILAVSIVVSVVTVLLDIVADDLVDKTNPPVVFVTGLSATGAATFGDVFLSGFLCRIVSDAVHGTRASIRQVAAGLPWCRLIRADLLVALLVIIGLAALIIPGLVVITLFAVAGPVIEIERRPVVSALRRSAGLARQHFWTVALLGTPPLPACGGPSARGRGERYQRVTACLMSDRLDIAVRTILASQWAKPSPLAGGGGPRTSSRMSVQRAAPGAWVPGRAVVRWIGCWQRRFPGACCLRG